uniref:DUF1501 domain-containing protein n=1 Tax=Ditylum brightwellii TaxID=49249 RepID=A0A6V2KAH0_9STRA
MCFALAFYVFDRTIVFLPSMSLTIRYAAQPLTKHDDYFSLTKVQLGAHNHMQRETYEVDTRGIMHGSGVGGRILDVLNRHGHQTSANAVEGRDTLVKGSPNDNNPVWTVSERSPGIIDQISSLPDGAMLDLVKQLNGEGEPENSLYGETWSAKLSQSLFQYEESHRMQTELEGLNFTLTSFPESPEGTLDQRFKSLAEYMSTRHLRKVDREVFVLSHEGYDMHRENTLGKKFSELNASLQQFIEELKAMGIWEDTALVMGSDFGRSVTANSNGGTDHAWGGNYFLLGGSVDGGKILGTYPEFLDERSDYWTGRGRMIPTTPWESVWNGIGQWMGVRGDNDLGWVLPNRNNFDKCALFSDQDLFLNGEIPQTACLINDGDGDGVADEVDQCPNSQYWTGLASDASGCQPPTAGPTTSPTLVPQPTIAPSSAPSVPPTPAPTVFGVLEVTPKASVITPDSAIVRVGGSNNHAVGRAIDGTTDKYEVHMSDAAKTGAGFEVTPFWPHSIVQGIRVYTASDGKSRDPTQFVVEGRNREGEAWTLIAGGDLNLSVERNPQGVPIDSSPSAPDLAKAHQEVTFQNTAAYSHYRVTFPETRSTSSTIVQFGEVELPGVWVPPGFVMTEYPTPAPSPKPTPAPTAVPTFKPTAAPSIAPTAVVTPVSTVLTPGSTVVRVRGYNTHTTATAIDGTTDVYQVHADGTGAPGFQVTPLWPYSIVQGIRVYTPYNGHSRDPMKFIVEGRNGDTEGWTIIAEGDLGLTTERNPSGMAIESTPTEPDMAKIHDEVLFQNTVMYSQYRVTFPEARSGSVAYGTIVQFGEVELPGLTVPPGYVLPTVTPVSTVLTPGSTVVRVRGYNTHTTATAIDGTTDVYQVHADGTGAPGFEVSPLWPYSIVQGIRVYTPHNGHGRDPMQFIVEGRNGDTEGWSVIALGDLGLTTERNPAGTPINSSPSAPDTSLVHDEVLFQNTVVYSQYRVTFPEARSALMAYGTIVQFGEVELPGLTVPPGLFVMTPYPTATPTAAPVAAAESNAIPVSTVLDAAAAPSIVRLNDIYPTHWYHNNVNIMDGTTSIYEIRMDGSGLPSGLEVTPTWPHSVIKSMRVYTARNGNSRDPTSFVIKGRNTDGEAWTLIAEGALYLPTDRNSVGLTVNSSPSAPDMALNHYEATFPNAVAYSQYQLTFPTTRHPDSTIVQFAELELPGLAVPEGWTCGGPGASCGNSHECCSEFCLGTGVCSDVTTQ